MVSIGGVCYGNLVAVNVDGIIAYVDEWYLKYLPGLTKVGEYLESTPVYTSLPLEVAVSYESHQKPNLYVTQRTDAIKLARALAKQFGWVAIGGSARRLVTYVNGLEGDIRTLDDFYLDVSDEERAATALF